MIIKAGGFPPAIFLTAIDIFSILRYTKSVLILIVQLVCHLLTILTEIYYEKEKNNRNIKSFISVC